MQINSIFIVEKARLSLARRVKSFLYTRSASPRGDGNIIDSCIKEERNIKFIRARNVTRASWPRILARSACKLFNSHLPGVGDCRRGNRCSESLKTRQTNLTKLAARNATHLACIIVTCVSKLLKVFSFQMDNAHSFLSSLLSSLASAYTGRSFGTR